MGHGGGMNHGTGAVRWRGWGAFSPKSSGTGVGHDLMCRAMTGRVVVASTLADGELREVWDVRDHSERNASTV